MTTTVRQTVNKLTSHINEADTNKTVYLTANKLINNLNSYFDDDKIEQASSVIIYFDQVYNNQDFGTVNILKMCLVSKKLEVLQQKYMPKFRFNISSDQVKNYFVQGALKYRQITKLFIEIETSELIGKNDGQKHEYHKIFIERPSKDELNYLGLHKHNLVLKTTTVTKQDLNDE